MKKYDIGYLEAINDFRDEAAAKLEEQDYITFDDLNEIAERMKEEMKRDK